MKGGFCVVWRGGERGREGGEKRGRRGLSRVIREGVGWVFVVRSGRYRAQKER